MKTNLETPFPKFMNNQFKKSKIIGAAVLVLAVAVSGILYWKRIYPWTTGTSGVTDDYEMGVMGTDETGKGGSNADGNTAEVLETYRHPTFGFSFQYPKGFKTGIFPAGEGETIVVEKSPEDEPTTAGGSAPEKAREGFQIYISAFDEEGPLTLERVKKEIPDLIVESPQTVILGSSASKDFEALVFFSRNESLGRTREAWFVWPQSPQPDGNYLYQISAYASFDAELSKIMATWKFD